MTDYPSSVLPASQYHQADHITVEGKGPVRIWRKCAHKCWSKSQPPNPPKAPFGDNQKKKNDFLENVSRNSDSQTF